MPLRYVARHPSCPSAALEVLIKDADGYVRMYAAGNQALPLGRICRSEDVFSSSEKDFAATDLNKLSELHDHGVLTEEEFVAAKGRLLGRND